MLTHEEEPAWQEMTFLQKKAMLEGVIDAYQQGVEAHHSLSAEVKDECLTSIGMLRVNLEVSEHEQQLEELLIVTMALGDALGAHQAKAGGQEGEEGSFLSSISGFSGSSLEDWDTLSLNRKKAILESVLINIQSKADFIHTYGQTKPQNQDAYNLEELHRVLEKLQTEDQLQWLIDQMAREEQALEPYFPEAIRVKTKQTLALLEKGLQVAPGIIPPDTIAIVQSVVANAKQALQTCHKTEEYMDIYAKLEEAREMLRKY